MKIVHVASIGNDLTQGVAVVVPQHVKAQAQLAQVCLVNIRNIDVMKGSLQCEYRGAKNFPEYLPEPFDKPDIVVFHEVNNFEYVRLYKNLLSRHIPYVIVPHGENTRGALRKKFWKKKIAYILFFNRFIRKAKALQCLSSGEYEETRTSDKKIIIPNGMELHERRDRPAKHDGMRLLYIGRLDWTHKGLDILIEAVSKTDVPGIELDIFGPDYAGRRAVVTGMIEKHGCADKIHMHDPVFGEDKVAEYACCDLFIQTSRFEGLPLGLLEAMSYGVPVIATEGTNLTKEIEKYDAGFTARTDAESVKEAIEIAFGEKDDWERKGDNARTLVETEFSWKNIAKEAVEKYKELTDE